MNVSQFALNRRDDLLVEIDRQLKVSRHRRERLALLVFNLSGFRSINVTYGHAAGDTVLGMVAQRVSGALRPCDRLFHIGNDEFAVLISAPKTPQVASLAAQQILRSIDSDYDIAGDLLAVSAVIGSAMFPDHAVDRDGLLRSADTALHLAREQGRDFLVYDGAPVHTEKQPAKLKSELRRALEDNALMLHYQPQIDLQHGRLSGCEALVRWLHPEQGLIQPDVFIPVAEKSGLIDTLTYWSVNVALREWLGCRAVCPGAAIAVNLSARLLRSAEVVDLVSRALNIWNAEPDALVLEVTESAMMPEPDTALRVLTALHRMGVKLSIDDFGTGYSSLAYLQKLPVSELKIDKSFVQYMADRPQDHRIVRSIIDLAHNLEMHVVAEGINDQRSLNMLIDMGCDFGQGFYLGRPMPAEDLGGWLQQAYRDGTWTGGRPG
jgi:diguanylate cyclase (GGDEF)-like protein